MELGLHDRIGMSSRGNARLWKDDRRGEKLDQARADFNPAQRICQGHVYHSFGLFSLYGKDNQGIFAIPRLYGILRRNTRRFQGLRNSAVICAYLPDTILFRNRKKAFDFNRCGRSRRRRGWKLLFILSCAH